MASPTPFPSDLEVKRDPGTDTSGVSQPVSVPTYGNDPYVRSDTGFILNPDMDDAATIQWMRERHSAQEAAAISAEEAEKDRQFQQNSADKAMEFEAEEAKKNRDWQTEMSNTAYQRQVADMKSAGLNPILAAYANGSSTPSGGVASGMTAAGSSAYGYKAGSQKATDKAVLQNNILTSVISSVVTALGIMASAYFRKK